MSAQKGKDLLLKLDDGTGTLVTVAGLRARRITFNAETVDATNADSVGRWRELLAGAGVLKASISGAGLFKDAQSDVLVNANFFNGVIGAWQVVIPGLGRVDGPFQITSLDYRGDHDSELTFDIALESAGALNFTAEA
jgi:TP901-1 family phage major tail protein